MDILNTMVPVFGIIGLGALLARIGFLSDALAEGLNRTVYYVALPAGSRTAFSSGRIVA